MSAGTKYPIDEVLPIAESLQGRLRPACIQIEIAGSIRRDFRRIGDIELVCISKPDRPGFGETPVLDAVTRLLNAMCRSGAITRRMWDGRNGKWGPKYKEFRLLTGGTWSPFKVDLFIVSPPAQWGSVFTIRTGPSSFSKALMVHVLPRRGLLQNDGHLETSNGAVVHTPTEVSYFKALGIEWIDPRDRSERELKRRLKASPVKRFDDKSVAFTQLAIEQGRLF